MFVRNNRRLAGFLLGDNAGSDNQPAPAAPPSGKPDTSDPILGAALYAATAARLASNVASGAFQLDNGNTPANQNATAQAQLDQAQQALLQAQGMAANAGISIDAPNVNAVTQSAATAAPTTTYAVIAQAAQDVQAHADANGIPSNAVAVAATIPGVAQVIAQNQANPAAQQQAAQAAQAAADQAAQQAAQQAAADQAAQQAAAQQAALQQQQAQQAAQLKAQADAQAAAVAQAQAQLQAQAKAQADALAAQAAQQQATLAAQQQALIAQGTAAAKAQADALAQQQQQLAAQAAAQLAAQKAANDAAAQQIATLAAQHAQALAAQQQATTQAQYDAAYNAQLAAANALAQLKGGNTSNLGLLSPDASTGGPTTAIAGTAVSTPTNALVWIGAALVAVALLRK